MLRTLGFMEHAETLSFLSIADRTQVQLSYSSGVRSPKYILQANSSSAPILPKTQERISHSPSPASRGGHCRPPPVTKVWLSNLIVRESLLYLLTFDLASLP